MRKEVPFNIVKSGQKFWESENSSDFAYLIKMGDNYSLSYRSSKVGYVGGVGIDSNYYPFEFANDDFVWVEIVTVPVYIIPEGKKFRFSLDGYNYIRLAHNLKSTRVFYLDENGVLQSIPQSTKVYEV